MTNLSGPPGPPNPPPYGSSYGQAPYGQAPYGQPPYGPPAARSGSSPVTLLTTLAAVAFVVATALAAWGVHDHGTRSAAAPNVQGGGYAPVSPGSFDTGGVPAAAGASSYPTSAISTPDLPTPSISSYVPPPPVPTPTHQPLDPAAVNRTFQVYMNALLYHSLQQLKSATCPKLRHTETGTALDGKYINRWQGHEYTIYPDRDYVVIAATVRYVNPSTGGNGKSHVYSWYVDRFADGQYWVCGILD